MANVKDADHPIDFQELDVVTIKGTLSVDGHIYPSGSRGTIVHTFPDREAFLIEFSNPAPTVAYLEIGDIDALQWRA
jgi:hypothetical protein